MVLGPDNFLNIRKSKKIIILNVKNNIYCCTLFSSSSVLFKECLLFSATFSSLFSFLSISFFILYSRSEHLSTSSLQINQFILYPRSEHLSTSSLQINQFILYPRSQHLSTSSLQINQFILYPRSEHLSTSSLQINQYILYPRSEHLSTSSLQINQYILYPRSVQKSNTLCKLKINCTKPYLQCLVAFSSLFSKSSFSFLWVNSACSNLKKTPLTYIKENYFFPEESNFIS